MFRRRSRGRCADHPLLVPTPIALLTCGGFSAVGFVPSPGGNIARGGRRPDNRQAFPRLPLALFRRLRRGQSRPRLILSIGKLFPEYHWLRFAALADPRSSAGLSGRVDVFRMFYHWLCFVNFRRWLSVVPSLISGWIAWNGSLVRKDHEGKRPWLNSWFLACCASWLKRSRSRWF